MVSSASSLRRLLDMLSNKPTYDNLLGGSRMVLLKVVQVLGGSLFENHLRDFLEKYPSATEQED